jgi:hypothetical protein
VPELKEMVAGGGGWLQSRNPLAPADIALMRNIGGLCDAAFSPSLDALAGFWHRLACAL